MSVSRRVFSGHLLGALASVGRVYLDADGERGPDGTIRAGRMTAIACLRKYGARD